MIVRKHDFVTGERLLQSFPYLLLENDWLVKLRKKTLLLAENVHYYFKNTPADYSIKAWQKRIIRYLEEQERLPFPLFRLYYSWEEFFHKKQFIQFQSARGEHFQLLQYLTEDLAYLTGAVMGDGHLADYFVNIIDASKEHITILNQLLLKLFNSRTEFFIQPDAFAWNVNILGKWIVRFFNFLSGQPISERKYPHLREPLLFQKNEFYRRAFWRGIMDADGSYKTRISFGSASEKMVKDFSNFLDTNNINHKTFAINSQMGKGYGLRISGFSREKYSRIISTSHPIKQKEMQSLLRRKAIPQPEDKKWPGQVQAFNQDQFIDNFFDFSKLPTLCVLHAGTKVKALRIGNHLSQMKLSRLIHLSRSLISRYESGATSIPLSSLEKILKVTSTQSLMSFLTINSFDLFQRNQTTIRLDLQPNPRLLALLQGLQFREGYIIIIGLQGITKEHYRQQLASYFSIPLGQRVRRIYNSILEEYVNEFITIS